MNSQRLLGIDYGSKRIGLALTDSTNTFATPHSVVSNSTTAIDEILQICNDNDVGTIIIGESHDYAGQDNPIQADIEKFVERIHGKSDIAVIYHPEFLTSFQSERTMHDLKGNKDMLDASAAALILQSYIDTHNNK